MLTASARQRNYGPQLAKTFEHALLHFVTTETPHLGGPKIRRLFVQEVMRLIEAHHVTQDSIKPGQMIWYAVAKDQRPSRAHRTMEEIQLIPVVLTVIAAEDIERLIKGESRQELVAHIVARLHGQAFKQGGVLSATDSSLILCYSLGPIGEAIRYYEHKHSCVIPRRGTVHDMGPTVTHKTAICRKVLKQGRQTPDAAWEMDHTLESADRYLLGLMRSYICLRRRGMDETETAFTTGMSVPLVNEYAALIEELGLSDEQLPSIMAELEASAQARSQQLAAD